MSNFTYKSPPLVASAALLVSLALSLSQSAIGADNASAIETQIQAVDTKVIAWRRDFHQNPELSNREIQRAW
jgi:amidohydrolase